VLCCRLPALMLDPQTFTQWMLLLHALPNAVLWLPAYAPAAQGNLQREAKAAGIDAQRLVFADERSGTVAALPLADLFLDTLRFNANQGLVDALRMGVPAVSCSGHNMASRLGGSILCAAGLADCVFDEVQAYTDAVIALGRNRDALAALRQRLQLARPTAPLFDTAARVKEWEAMWTHMVLRQRAGLPPASFDVPAAAPTLA
jgi:protein O-GlcNAc transferase